MMSKMKRFLSCLLVGCVTTSVVSFTAGAVEEQPTNTINESSQPEMVMDTSIMPFEVVNAVQPDIVINEVVSADDEDWKVTVLDEATYAKLLVEKSGMDVDSAKIKAQETFSELERENSMSRAVARKVVTTVSQTYYPSGCQAYGMGIEYGFYAYKTSGSPSSYEEAWGPWAIAAGSGPHTYVSGGVSAKVSAGSVDFNANGNLEVAVQNSVSVGGNISSGTLVNIGFSKNRTVGITTYYRKYVSYYKKYVGGY